MTRSTQPAAGLQRQVGLNLHDLRPNVLKLRESIVIGLGTSAPGQSTAVSLAGMVAVAAYATGPAIVIALVPMLILAMCYQRLNQLEPNCGGPYVWVARAIHPLVGGFVAWTMIVGFVLGAISDLLPLGPALLGLFGVSTGSVMGNVATATAFGVVLTVLAAVGVKLTARFQIILAAVEYAILLTFSGIAFWAVFVDHSAGTVHPHLSWLSPSGVGGHGSLSAAMLVAIFLYAGWDAPMYLNEETRRPTLTPGRAVIWSVVILGLIYAWLFVVFQGVTGAHRLAAHADDALPFLASVLVGHSWARVMVIAVVLSVLGTTQATLVATARITYAMGTDRLLPRFFGTTHHRYQTPFFATLFWGGLTVVVVDLYIASSSLANAFNTVVDALGIAFAVFWALTALAATIHFRHAATRTVTNGFLLGVLPLGAAATLIWIVAQQVPQLSSSARWTVIGLGLAGIGLTTAGSILHLPFFEAPRAR
jgi:amino acid transporter